MPGFDRTGPMGRGTLSGRGFGPCGMGFGGGFGWRNWQGYPVREPVALTKEEQKKILEAELKELEAEKKEIERALKELKE